MSQSQEFQAHARLFASRAADRLREAARKLDDAYTGDTLPSDTLTVIEATRSGMFDAMSCLAHASHNHALAVLHKEREKNARGLEGGGVA